jgi:hypothetical protein
MKTEAFPRALTPPPLRGKNLVLEAVLWDFPFSREVLRDFRDSRCFQWNQEK